MKQLIYYSPPKLALQPWASHPDFIEFFKLFQIMSSSVVFLDRTGTIRSPIQSKNLFPMGDLSLRAEASYSDLMLQRAKELLSLSDSTGTPIGLMWSGGIDSTAVLVSLIRTESNLRDRLRIFMSNESIREYPDFYRRYVRGRFRLEPSHAFSDYIDGSHLLVMGEGNDQLFGSDLAISVIRRFGFDFLMRPFSRDSLRKFLEYAALGTSEDHFIAKFEELAKKCPSGIENLFQFLWWLNFSCKWQSVYVRLLGYLSPFARRKLNQESVASWYHCFFMTDNFQRWSVWNNHLKILSDWKSYKVEAKKFILDFTNDRDYFENKVKGGSLFRVLQHQRPILGIDSEFHFLEQLALEEIYDSENSFKPN